MQLQSYCTLSCHCDRRSTVPCPVIVIAELLSPALSLRSQIDCPLPCHCEFTKQSPPLLSRIDEFADRIMQNDNHLPRINAWQSVVVIATVALLPPMTGVR